MRNSGADESKSRQHEDKTQDEVHKDYDQKEALKCSCHFGRSNAAEEGNRRCECRVRVRDL